MSSLTGAGAGVRFVSPRGSARGHIWERDPEDISGCAVVDDLIDLAGPFDERLPSAVGFDLAMLADRFVNGERALLDDDDRAARVGVPAGGAAGLNCDRRHGDICSDVQWDGSV